MQYSKTTGSFYPKNIKYDDLPLDVIDVSKDEYKAAMSRAPGETLDVVDGKLVIVLAPVPDPAVVLADAKSEVARQVSDLIQKFRVSIAATSDAIEVAAWANKLRIAMAIKSGNAAETDIASFRAEVALRALNGETVDSFTDKVLENAARYSMAVAVLDGLKRSTQDKISQAQNTDEVVAVLNDLVAELDRRFGAQS